MHFHSNGTAILAKCFQNVLFIHTFKLLHLQATPSISTKHSHHRLRPSPKVSIKAHNDSSMSTNNLISDVQVGGGLNSCRHAKSCEELEVLSDEKVLGICCYLSME
eukprot:369635-Amphidinium_carterae.1